LVLFWEVSNHDRKFPLLLNALSSFLSSLPLPLVKIGSLVYNNVVLAVCAINLHKNGDFLSIHPTATKIHSFNENC
jgi:hypothetical protein